MRLFLMMIFAVTLAAFAATQPRGITRDCPDDARLGPWCPANVRPADEVPIKQRGRR